LGGPCLTIGSDAGWVSPLKTLANLIREQTEAVLYFSKLPALLRCDCQPLFVFHLAKVVGRSRGGAINASVSSWSELLTATDLDKTIGQLQFFVFSAATPCPGAQNQR
jgi:hypothetical protein